jgi:hypothetical protein
MMPQSFFHHFQFAGVSSQRIGRPPLLPEV